MKIIKNNGKVPEVTSRYMFEANIKNIGRKAYAKPGIKTAFYGILYELGIAKWPTEEL